MCTYAAYCCRLSSVVCLSQSWVVQKWLNRSIRCQLGWGQEPLLECGYRSLHGKGQFCKVNGLPSVCGGNANSVKCDVLRCFKHTHIHIWKNCGNYTAVDKDMWILLWIKLCNSDFWQIYAEAAHSLIAWLCFVVQLHWWLPIAVGMRGLCPWTWSWHSAAETWTQSPAPSGQSQWLWSPSAGDRLSYRCPVLASASSAGRQWRQWRAVVHDAILCHKYSQWVAFRKSNCKIGCLFCFVWLLRCLGLLSFMCNGFSCCVGNVAACVEEQCVWMCMLKCIWVWMSWNVAPKLGPLFEAVDSFLCCGCG